MKPTTIGSIVFALHWSVLRTVRGSESDLTNAQGSPRIIGGQAIDIRYVPYTLYLLDRKSGVDCGASVIAAYFALTAGHCVDKAGTSELVLRGASTYKGSGGHLFYVDHYEVPGDASVYPLNDDVAVLRVNESFLDYPGMSVVPLQDQDPATAIPPVSCFAVGWGDTSFPQSSDRSTDHLKIGHYQLVAREGCVEQWATRGLTVTEEMLCADSQPANVCAGDSGGPFVCDGRLYGIVSFTTLDCSNELPQGFTRVSAPKIRSFIRAVAAV